MSAEEFSSGLCAEEQTYTIEDLVSLYIDDTKSQLSLTEAVLTLSDDLYKTAGHIAASSLGQYVDLMQ